jgi:predicted molibdopterin-dependent oxidoreductase YjgC
MLGLPALISLEEKGGFTHQNWRLERAYRAPAPPLCRASS